MFANYEEMSKHLWQEHMNTEARVQFQEQEQRYLAERRDYIKRIDEMRQNHNKDWVCMFDAWSD